MDATPHTLTLTPSRAAREQAGRWRLARAERALGGPGGERIARGVGASLELHDRRAYQSGDDVRHVDWRAYARTDQLLVKLYHEERRPRLELLLDLSRSMAVDEAKAQLALDVAFVLLAAAEEERLETRLLALGARVRRSERLELERGLAFDGVASLDAALREARPLLAPGALRVLVSDLLSPAGARELVRPLASGAGEMALVEVLGAFDADPRAGEALRMIDSESGAELPLVLDEAAVSRYRARLSRHREELALEARRAAARHALLVADTHLATHCRGALVHARILAPV